MQNKVRQQAHIRNCMDRIGQTSGARCFGGGGKWLGKMGSLGGFGLARLVLTGKSNTAQQHWLLEKLRDHEETARADAAPRLAVCCCGGGPPGGVCCRGFDGGGGGLVEGGVGGGWPSSELLAKPAHQAHKARVMHAAHKVFAKASGLKQGGPSRPVCPPPEQYSDAQHAERLPPPGLLPAPWLMSPGKIGIMSNTNPQCTGAGGAHAAPGGGSLPDRDCRGTPRGPAPGLHSSSSASLLLSA